MRITFFADNEKNIENMNWLAGIMSSKQDNIVSTVIMKREDNKGRYGKSMSDSFSELFDTEDALVFFKSPSFVVSMIFKNLKQGRNPEIIAIDDKMNYIVSLNLGKNDVAVILSRVTGANAILADDEVGIFNKSDKDFSLIKFAKNNRLTIIDKTQIEFFENRIRKGKKTGFVSEIGYNLLKNPLCECREAKAGIVITNKTDKRKFKQQLVLCPKNITLCISVSKNIELMTLESFIKRALLKYSYNERAVLAIASIDGDNEIISEYSKKHEIRYRKYSAKEFKRARDMFKVKKVKGEGISLIIISGPAAK